ncbi:MAG: alcohol acetyltransferase [Eubacteriales bacterium]|nr:alcohol acetyltransferase [Eubacteriales bacterium]
MVKKNPPPDWLKLDNAAKIYPAAKTRSWTAVFRLSITLDENIRPDLLQEALNKTLVRVPFFNYRLRRGFFWYYLDKQNNIPSVQPDVRNPCNRMLRKSEEHSLFRIRYYEKRIALEVFHSLADGTGAMSFLATLVAEYLRLSKHIYIPPCGFVLDTKQAPLKEEWEDSFSKYAREGARSRSEEKAYSIKGTPLFPGHITLTTGIVDTQELKRKANSLGCGINVFLSALLLQAILLHQEQHAKGAQKKLPVRISIPQNLRKYYPVKTLRNFSSYYNVGLNASYGDFTLEDIIHLLLHTAKIENMEPMINARMSSNVKAEQNRLLRLIPLFMKSPFLKLMYTLFGERYFSMALSNLGDVKLPEAMRRHVKRIDFILGPARYNAMSLGVISTNGVTTCNFSSTIHETDIQRSFFRGLVKNGIHVKVESNRRE